MVVRQQPAEADAVFGIAGFGRATFNDLHAGPNAAGILPAAAGAAQPLAEDSPRRDQLALRLAQAARQRFNLPGGPHASGDNGCQEIRRYGQARAFGDVVYFADDLQPQPSSDELCQHVGERLFRPFQSRRDNARGDHGCFEQAEIILREVKYVNQLGDVGLAFQVDARQAEHRLVNHAEPDFDRRLWLGISSANAKVDRDIQHPRPFREIHAQEENVAPAAVREVHADRRPLDKDGEGLIGRGAVLQCSAYFQRMVGRMAHAEHPLIAADGADTAADLVGQSLKADGLIGGGQRTGDGIARTESGLDRAKIVDRLLKPAAQQMHVAGERHEGLAGAGVCRASDSGRSRQERRSPARARKGFRSCGGSHRAPAPH